MNYPPESPHQAAIAQGQPKPEPAFKSKQRPVLPPFQQQLVAAYDNTYGASAPYCSAEGLSAVLDLLADQAEDFDLDTSSAGLRVIARGLRGELP